MRFPCPCARLCWLFVAERWCLGAIDAVENEACHTLLLTGTCQESQSNTSTLGRHRTKLQQYDRDGTNPDQIGI
eukprot:6473456-Amphidinium_carterae.1